MKNKAEVFFLLLGFLFLAMNASYSQEQPRLKVFAENYPNVVYFRSAEQTHEYDSYEEWQDKFDNLFGFIGQALPYDLSDHVFGDLIKNPEYYKQFKKDHPDQIIMMHLNGNAQDPRRFPTDYFAGHWLYYEGTTVLSDMEEDMANMTIRVEDASLFHTDIGFTGDRNEDVGICILNEDGTPNWNYSEQAEIISVDKISNTITIRRGLYSSAPMQFETGKAYVAAHVWNGPWGPRRRTIWHYNYSTKCPKDALGRNCADMFVKYLSESINKGGPLDMVDGLAFDVVYNAPRVNQRNAKGRLPDFDADGKGDDFNLDHSYTIGVIEFFKKLRDAVDDSKFITSDGQGLDNQRSFGILNGMESEGWPSGGDASIHDWSGGLNRLLFWNANARKPVLSYTNFKYYRNIDKDEITPAHARMVMAVSVFTSSVYALSWRPDKVFDGKNQTNSKELEVWDELVMGEAKQPGWLGKPLGPMMHIVENSSYKKSKLIPSIDQNLLERLVGEEVEFSIQDNVLRVESGKNEIRFLIKDIPVESEDMTIFINAKAENRSGFPEEYARMYFVSAGRKGLPLCDRITHYTFDKNRFMSFVNDGEFTSGFYFSELENGYIDLEILIESGEPVWIAGIEAFPSVDIVYREFENGLVLANPSNASVELNMKDLFPKSAYRRLMATEDQDRLINNGKGIGSKLLLNSKDALFLIKEND